jgi:glycogen debranching enzyme
MSFIISRAGKQIAHGVLAPAAVFATAAAVGVIAAHGMQSRPASIKRFPLREEGLHLERRAHAGAFFDVLGRRSALLGYENRELEAWVYPLKILDDFALSFRLEGYPLDIDGRDIVGTIEARPAATILTYAHAAFTIRQIMMAPLDTPGALVLLDVNSALPLTITASFRPRLRLMWPATSMTANTGWDANEHVYYVTEESGKYAGVIGCPIGREDSIMPYQEEPRDVPVRLTIAVPPDIAKTEFIPIVVAGSTEGKAAAKATYDSLLDSAQSLYDQLAVHYERLERETIAVTTPDVHLNAAFSWAKVGIDKGVVTNPYLGTGLVAGFRTSGESERPGFAWFFGRDAAWTTLATTAQGAFATSRGALEFLRRFQRDDGKIPHEISQTATLLPWFDAFPYAWASADATPLYIVSHGDYWRATGDRDFIRSAWPSLLKAYRFSAATDTDGNGLIENTNVGHGWVEGGALYPAHEEIYLQGVWVEAARALTELAAVVGDTNVAATAKRDAERARTAIEQTFWLPDRSHYAFATAIPRTSPPVAEPGPNRNVRQRRLDALRSSRLIDEDTVLPAVPLWFGVADPERAQLEIDHLGSGALATDWGSRILSNHSELYDPLSYHYGSVWPLFTGWTAMAAYRYDRPHVGYQAVMANANLTSHNALGYVTELLSGDFATPFGRSSHHQIWSEAMVVTPVIRGLFGIDVNDGGRTLRFAPSLPADWDHVAVHAVPVGAARYDIKLDRTIGRTSIHLVRHETGTSPVASGRRLLIAPAFPLDARIRGVSVNGKIARFDVTAGLEIQRVVVAFQELSTDTEVTFSYDEGTDVYLEPNAILTGQMSTGLRVLRSQADATTLRLLLEGRGGRGYRLYVRSPRRVGQIDGVTIPNSKGSDQQIEIAFDGAPDTYVRREIALPLLR